MFSYGSGLAASFFSIRVKGDTSEMSEKLNLVERLGRMEVRPCSEYVKALEVSSFWMDFFLRWDLEADEMF